MAISASFLRRVAWATFAVAVLGVIASVVLFVLNLGGRDHPGSPEAGDVLLFLALFSFPVVGVVIVSRRPRNPIGWILLAIGFAWEVGIAPVEQYTEYGFFTNPGSLPRPELVYALTSSAWLPAVGLMGTFLLLLFPDGRLPSPRWRPLAWLSALILFCLTVLFPFIPGSIRDFANDRTLPDIANPLGIAALRPLKGVGEGLVLLLLLCMAGCALSAILRYRRSDGDERLQLRWLAAGAGLSVALYLVFMLVGAADKWGLWRTPAWLEFVAGFTIFSFVLIPGSVGIAVLKYRLYDLGVVINKTLVFGALAAFITAVYVGIVVGVGQLIGSTEDFDIGLSIAATAVVAIAFQPFRERVQRLANRLVYGKRATPYEILSNFTERVANTYAADEILPRLAQNLGQATGATRAQVWLAIGDRLVPGAAWPGRDEEPLESISLAVDSLPEMGGVDRVVAVEHKGEFLGALSVTKAPGDPVRPVEDDLLQHLASQAGLVLRNVRLTTELRARLDEISRKAAEIRASRERIVAREDDERRRLERNLHDGAQQHLVALAVKLRLAASLATRDPNQARSTLVDLRADMDVATRTLEQLARGIYPELLSERGLGAALTAQVEYSDIPVTITADGVGRYPIETEAAVYFCCLEALQNVAKYSQATTADVELREEGSELVFMVTDDGVGFDPQAAELGSGLRNMTDRMESVGGIVEVSSTPGKGTTIMGQLPLRDREAVGSR